MPTLSTLSSGVHGADEAVAARRPGAPVHGDRHVAIRHELDVLDQAQGAQRLEEVALFAAGRELRMKVMNVHWRSSPLWRNGGPSRQTVGLVSTDDDKRRTVSEPSAEAGSHVNSPHRN